MFLDRAHVLCNLVLHAAAVLFAELYPTIGAEADDGDEANGPGEGDDEAGLGDSRVEILTWNDERRGVLRGSRGRGLGCSIGARRSLLGEDTVHKGRFGRGEGSFKLLAGGGVLCRELDLWDQEGLEGGSGGRSASCWCRL